MQYTLFIVLAPIACVFSVGLLLYAWRCRASAEISAFGWLMISIAGWLIFNTLELVARSPSWTLAWAKVTYLFIVSTPVAWLTFIMQYVGLRKWLRSPGYWAVAVIPAITALLVWTNQAHHLVWRSYRFEAVGDFLALQVDHGPWFWVYVVTSYGMVVAGALLVARRHFTALNLYRQQTRWLLLGGFIPVLYNAVYVLRLIPGLLKDYTPISFALAGIAFAAGMFWHRLFDVRPVARATLIDTMSDPVITVDVADRIVDLNPAAYQLLSKLEPGTVPARLLGRPIDVLSARWPALVRCLGGPGVDSVDIDLLIGEQMCHYECHPSHLKSQRNRPAGRLIVLHDITERKKAEEALRYHLAELETSNKQLDAFADAVAHDLKGPLSTMIGYAEMLKLTAGELSLDEILQHLDTFLRTGYRMTRIVDALLLLAKVYRQEDVTLDTFDMNMAVGEALLQVQSALEARDGVISVPEDWPWASGYMPWVIEVWINYLTNAIKYGGTPPRIELGYDFPAADAPSDGADTPIGSRFVRFWVKDNGPGLSVTQTARLFTPFTRLHPSRASGHGLGLSIVHRIVVRLGGQVGVDSTPEGGSTFWFTLPGAGVMSEDPSEALDTQMTRLEAEATG